MTPMTKTWVAGVALAAAIVAAQPADAAGRRVGPSCAVPVQGGWYHAQSSGGYYVPTAPSAVPVAPAPTYGPPTAQGQVIRRFSEEPGVAPAPVPATTGVAPAPTYRPTAPAVSTAPRSSTPARNPVDRRLRPGAGWQR
jgi:hypothetical protein